jgi:hypothetical protein
MVLGDSLGHELFDTHSHHLINRIPEEGREIAGELVDEEAGSLESSHDYHIAFREHLKVLVPCDSIDKGLNISVF